MCSGAEHLVVDPGLDHRLAPELQDERGGQSDVLEHREHPPERVAGRHDLAAPTRAFEGVDAGKQIAPHDVAGELGLVGEVRVDRTGRQA